MNNYIERTWTMVTIGEAIKNLMKAYVKYPPREIQSMTYDGPIEISKLGKLTCEDFIGIDDVIKPQYIIAAVAHTKGGKAKKVVIEIVDTDTLVPFLIEECQQAPKESFWAKLKSKLKL